MWAEDKCFQLNCYYNKIKYPHKTYKEKDCSISYIQYIKGTTIAPPWDINISNLQIAALVHTDVLHVKRQWNASSRFLAQEHMRPW